MNILQEKNRCRMLGILVTFVLVVFLFFVSNEFYTQIKTEQSLWILFKEKSRLLFSNNPEIGRNTWDMKIDSKNLSGMIEERAINGTILITILDTSYVDMTLNLWESSYLRFNITNYLFICLSQEAQARLQEFLIPCFLLEGIGITDDVSPFGTPHYNLKVMVKPKLCYHILKMGYNTMMVDGDVVLFQNPMPYMTCDRCDLIIQNNSGGEVNSGFFLIKPTPGGLTLQRKILEAAQDSSFVHDQQMFNRVLQIYKGTNTISMKVLDLKRFQPGCDYFGRAEFATDARNEGIVMVHNNWIVGIPGKVYRFKEMLLWEVDTEGYYSNDTQNYMAYSLSFGTDKFLAFKVHNFAINLGKALGRNVILPKFTCYNESSDNTTKNPYKCNFRSCFGYAPYAPYQPSIRESVFLDHHKVPENVKQSISPVIHLNDKTNDSIKVDTNSIYLQLEKKHSDIEADIVDKLKSLGLMSYRVLQFGSLNNMVS